MFERFTVEARRVLVDAGAAASERSERIAPEHLLFGVAASGGAGGEILGGLGLSAERIAGALLADPIGTVPPVKSPPFGRDAKRTLELALREALTLGQSFVGTGHLLLAIDRDNARCSDWLHDRGFSRESAIEHVQERIETGGPRQPRRLPRRTGRVTEPAAQELASGIGVADGAARDREPADDSAAALLALASEEGSAAQQVLTSLGVDATSLADAVRNVALSMAAADGPVSISLGQGVVLNIEAGERAREMRDRLRLLVLGDVVKGETTEDGVFVVSLPALGETVRLSVEAWLDAAGETLH